MSKNIIVSVLDDDLDEVSWLVCDDQGSPVSASRTATLEQAATQVEGRRVTVVVPADWVVLLSAEMPASAASRLTRLLPNVLEEQLSEDVEKLHFAPGKRRAGNRWPVAVISHERMQRMQARFEACGLRPTEVRPEPLALPLFGENDSSWTALQREGALVARLGADSGFGIETDLGPLLLSRSLEDAGEEKPAGLVLFNASADEAVEISGFDAVEERPCTDRTALYAKGVFNTEGINLFQGDYSIKQRFDKAWKPWRGVMALAALLLVTLWAGKFIEYRQLGSIVAGQRAAMTEIVKRTFPDVKRVTNPQRQMRSELRKLGAGVSNTGFVPVMDVVSRAVSANGKTTLNSVNYKTGRMDLDLQTDALGTLDVIKREVESAGPYSLSVESANQVDGGIRGRLRVEVQG
ncbi:type II secretion system protein GspL [Granulosicoccaceae sp. 1_MG-2023]|nr:type II secretion system protein GspL [Granulosicoccaceae sp. 1_MG-2023]